MLSDSGSELDMELLHDPIRLELREDIQLTYGDTACDNSQVTLCATIERHNFGTVQPTTLLGWVSGSARECFTARDSHGKCAVDRLVEMREGALYPAQPLKLFMVTNNSEIAKADCLFYAVAENAKADWHS